MYNYRQIQERSIIIKQLSERNNKEAKLRPKINKEDKAIYTTPKNPYFVCINIIFVDYTYRIQVCNI